MHALSDAVNDLCLFSGQQESGGGECVGASLSTNEPLLRSCLIKVRCLQVQSLSAFINFKDVLLVDLWLFFAVSYFCFCAD